MPSGATSAWHVGFYTPFVPSEATSVLKALALAPTYATCALSSCLCTACGQALTASHCHNCTVHSLSGVRSWQGSELHPNAGSAWLTCAALQRASLCTCPGFTMHSLSRARREGKGQSADAWLTTAHLEHVRKVHMVPSSCAHHATLKTAPRDAQTLCGILGCVWGAAATAAGRPSPAVHVGAVQDISVQVL